MKKKILSLALALVLCLSLTVPALADDDPPISPEEGTKYIEWTGDLPGSEDWVEQDFYVPAEINIPYFVDTGAPATLDGYTATTKDQVFTVKHTGPVDDGTFIYITGYVYTPDPDGSYSAEGISYELHMMKDRGLIMWEEQLNDDDYVELHAGESVTFTLPTSSSYISNLKDAIYHVQVFMYYPQYGGGYSIQSFFKIDEDYVSKVLSSKPAASGRFTDVADSSPYRDAIDWAVEQGITLGKTQTTFGPNDYCTIGQILTFLWRANGRPGAGSDERASVLAWAKTLGIDSPSFDARCTRSNAVTYLWKAAGSPAPKSTASFQDVSASADYARAVSWAVEQKITAGTTSTTFSPNNFCTRGQIVTFLYRAQ